MTALPIDEALPDLLAALRADGRAVLQAPPGAGKTTRVPLAMLEAGLTTGRIVMLEPRRLAARAAAERMAETLGEPVGQTVGYRMRGETKVSRSCRIEVVTEGILTRMLQSDPELTGVGALIFDEFHERSLNADLGLALAWEARGALREDLLLLVMSATLDAAPVATLLGDAPLVSSEGRSFAVDIRWRQRPLPKGARLEHAVAEQVREALRDTDGGVLVFLPGEGEIRRVQGLLSDLPQVHPLYGALPFKAQRAAVAPARTGRKVVLATSIAETALTIQDVRVVIDAGRARRARYDPGRGMSSLVTERVTKAEATQRAGRAGRVAPGVCYRLWTKGEEGGLAAFPPPEIAAADLSGLALELALWGAGPDDLAFLTPPPAGSWSEATGLLQGLQALDLRGRITGHGRAMAALPLHPRLAHMLLTAGAQAAGLAALMNERDPMREAGADLEARLSALRQNHPAFDRIRREADRLAKLAPRAGASEGAGVGGWAAPSEGRARGAYSAAEQAALAYPDRIGLRRPGDLPSFLLSGGTGAAMDASDRLAGQRLIVATDLDGAGREARIRRAIALTEAELRGLYGDRIAWEDSCAWSPREKRVVARRRERFGALVLGDRKWEDVPPEAIAAAMLEGVRAMGLPWAAPARRLQSRIALARSGGEELPDCSDAALMAALDDWLMPYLTGIRSAADLKSFDLCPALKARIGWDGEQVLNRRVPGNFVTPLGRRIAIDYTGGGPEIAVRLQEMFGVTTHPTVAGIPVKVTLLSPAQRPVQTTLNLPGFWTGSYADVRKDMRARYPRHPWPEDPTQADPTLRAKRRS
ncbi:ATP-dependent helicase HrpB [Candidatus Rhodobacter oscarellae]|uniref:ATP-dependent helicase HrpB n=1 Tax=Candidatus Rhodobacter oscarellae TaxID=1675527 RepID=A0A0J9E5Z7_9RHOB|nr:ATP-dependent helicase HrpB [Candidatus Rhodobacter lobularis]KMW58137.1 ATP-dependent helicase HrpB [Candidatus Rhodobacter lobularis]